jgi:hypothetical protein
MTPERWLKVEALLARDASGDKIVDRPVAEVLENPQ